jgi:hypothetical protein
VYVLAYVSGGEEAKLRGLPPERGRGTMAASWPGGIVVSMAGGRDGEGGTGSGCGATDCSSVMVLLLLMF